MSTPGDDMTVLERLLADALEQREMGREVDLDTICRRHPELRADVEAALQRVQSLHRAHLAEIADPALGDEIGGRYRLDAYLGSGAMGVVYAATDLRLARPVAVKVLRRELVVGARMDQRLAREAMALARISHPHVVTVHDSGQCADGRSFLVMERLRGCSLGTLLQRVDGDVSPAAGRLARIREVLGNECGGGDSDVRLLVGWIAQAAEGVHAAHVAGVVHRDIKPSNLFVDASGKVVVVDFGIVSVSDAVTVGGDGSPLGTPAYMAPEQLVLGIKADVRCDVYGLSATLYHLLTGRPPFTGAIQQVLHAVTRQEPERADQVRPGLPADLVAIVEKGMAKGVERRYPTAAALRDDLVAWLEHRPVSARRASWIGAAWRRSVRSPAVRAVTVAMLLGVGSLAAWQWSESRAADRRAEEGPLWGLVPPSLVNELPHQRATNQLRKDVEVARLLDRLVEIAEEPAIALALRATHRSDGGDLAAAAADVERIVALQQAPFAARVAARFRAGRMADDFVVPERAPECGGPGDRALAALVAMRGAGERPHWVEGLLAVDDGIQRHPLFADLWLLLGQDRAEARTQEHEQVQAFEALERAAAKLEGRRSGVSAIASLVTTNALLRQGRRSEALDVAERGCKLAPGDFALWLLAGSTALRNDQFELASQRLQHACELQPRSLHAHRLWCDALLALERFEEADQVFERAPFSGGDAGDVERSHQRGMIRLGTYLARTNAGTDRPAAADVELLRAALESFRAARGNSTTQTSLEEIVCKSLLGEPFSRRDLIDLMASRALDGRLLAHVASQLPETLNVEETAAVRRLLEAQARTLTGSDR